MMWGRSKENGLWRAKRRQRRLMLGGGDRLVYLAFGKFRIRLMNPFIREGINK